VGTILGILYQNAIPIFCDLDPHTYNPDPKSIAEKITGKTKAIIVVHLAGNPADMDPIMETARKRGVKVVEDCAQSFECFYKGRRAGTIGDIGCFSTNDYKHISTGDGGMCLINDDELYNIAHRFADKNYARLTNTANPSREIGSLAPNYRMTELQGAVGLAQLGKLTEIGRKRNAYGDGLTRGINGLPGIYPHKVYDGCVSSYWFYMLRVNESEAGVSRDDFASALNAEGVPCSAGYINSCVYEYDLFTKKNAYHGTKCPFDCVYYGKEIEYRKGLCPTAEGILETAVKLNVNEFYTETDLEETAAAIKKVAAFYKRKS
jgi:dTDP-4-amino-4,6-dideoxygalactose transaminase